MTDEQQRTAEQGRLVATGVEGLDEILGGGLTPNRVYLVEGNPGSGKTTLALRCLLEGAERGESALYVTLSETRAELIAVSESHGWSLDGIHIVELIAQEEELDPDNQFAMFESSEMELGATIKTVLLEVERHKPARVVIDSLSEIRLLAQNSLRYRRQILALKQFFIGRQCTVLLLDDRTSEVQDLQLESLAHGVLNLEQLSPEYGAERRRLRVAKLRGQRYQGGYHDFAIRPGGLAVYPRMVAARHGSEDAAGPLKSGVVEVDALLGGGVEFGTSVLLIGPAGSGKSTFAVQFARFATQSGMKAVVFAFDERRQTIIRRTTSLGMDLTDSLEKGRLTITQVDPAELSPGEFAYEIRKAVEGEAGEPGAKVVVIDSLNGYMNAMPEEKFLTAQLHELLTYLGNKGVATFLVVAQYGLVGNNMDDPVDASYMADTVVLFRYFEAEGCVRQALSVIKKRVGEHERTIRELRLTRHGIEVGEPLDRFQGVLTGTPTFVGSNDSLMRRDDD